MSAVLEREPPKVYQDYSLERKAEVIALVQANGGNVLQTARETGIPHQTIRLWLDKPERFSSLEKQKQEDLAKKLENQAHLYLDLAAGKAAEAPFNHLMTGAGIAIDKMQLLRGQPTNITESVERQELVCILQSALSSGAIEVEGQVVESIEVNAAQNPSGHED